MFLRRRSLMGLIRVGVLCGAACSSLIAYAQREDEIPNNELGLFSSERGFRINATHKVMPEYPAEALKDGAQGVVVLSLYHDGEGNASHIRTLEAPHPAISEAAVNAARQWKWRPFVSGGIPRPVRGKLTFYFVIEGGVGRAENPRIITIEEEMSKKVPAAGAS